MSAPRAHGAVDESGEGSAGRRTLTARRMAELVGGVVVGDPDAQAWKVAPIERAEAGSVTFLGGAKYAPFLASTGASVVLIAPEVAEAPGAVPARILVARPQEALLTLLPHLHPASPRQPGIHPTAVIGRGARLGAEVEIGPYVVIGAGATIGNRARLLSHVVVGEGVTVGDDVQLYPGVTVYGGTTLGDRVIVHAGARLGCDGFGYVFSEGAHRKIPHVGRCLIQADVEIGANTTIDRGSIGDTMIGAGSKIDNLVQVAHNVQIGKLCLIMAQVGIAGSVRVGDGCILAGQVGVSGHHTIGDGARLAAQAGVFGDIPAGETWSGYPARPHREALRSHAALFKLSGMLKRLEKLLDDRKDG